MISKNFLNIAMAYDVVMFDIYGVINTKEGIIPQALEILKKLKQLGKKVYLVSNASNLAAHSEARYAKKGLLKGEHYDDIVTSGQFAYEQIQGEKLPLNGRKYCVFGTANFKRPDDLIPDILKNSSYELCDINEADFAYCGVPQIDGKDRTEIYDFLPELMKLLQLDLPLVVANPDEVASEDGRFVVRQGAICIAYEKLGGKTVVYGKPDARILGRTIGSDANRMMLNALMVGDTLRTDILAGNRFGIDTCLTLKGGVTEEMMKRNGMDITEENLCKYISDQNSGEPTYVVNSIWE